MEVRADPVLVRTAGEEDGHTLRRVLVGGGDHARGPCVHDVIWRRTRTGFSGAANRSARVRVRVLHEEGVFEMQSCNCSWFQLFTDHPMFQQQ